MEITVFHAKECQAAVHASSEALPALLKSQDQIIWVDMIGPTEEDLRVLRDVFHFHPLAIEDTRNQRQRPKVEEYQGYVFTILNAIFYSEHEVGYQELDIFAGPNYLVTVHGDETPIVQQTRRRVEETCQVQPISSGYLLYMLVDSIVDSYFPILDQIGDEIEALENYILQRAQETHLTRLFVLKRVLNEMWRIAGHQRDMFGIILREEHVLLANGQLRYYLRDVYDHLLRIGDTINTFRDTLSTVVDLYMSAVSNRLNQQVNRLTTITMGIGLLAVLTGFYGMNFERTWPPFDAPGGVPFVLLVMIGVVLLFLYLLYARRNRR